MKFSSKPISALLNTGNLINLMSQELFDNISPRNKLQVEYCNASIVLAKNQEIGVNCVAKVSAVISRQQQSYRVHPIH